MAAEDDHAAIVQLITDTHEQRVLESLQRLEAEIEQILLDAPTREGKLFDLAWSVNARTTITQSFTSTYLAEADSLVRDYDRIQESLAGLFDEYGTLLDVPPDIITNLKRISFQGFEDIATTFSDELANELYQNTLTGRSLSDTVTNLRQKINGVYIQSDEAEIRRLVDIANSGGEGAEEAIRELHQVYAADRAGRNMRRYARQMATDSVNQYNASLNVTAGQRVGATKWKYFGSLIRDSRQFCRDRVGNEYTEDEIREIWSTQDWAGKAPGDPFVVRGGYNCRHHWRPVFESES
jgi:hypothetical protein